MLRFGENGLDINALQWVSPSGSIVSSTRFSTDRWYMISLTYDGSKLTMYVDGGKMHKAMVMVKPVDFQRFELGNVVVGIYRGSQYFRGRIAEVRVWNRFEYRRTTDESLALIHNQKVWLHTGK